METSNNKKPLSLVLADILDNTYFRVYFGVLILFPLSLILFLCAIILITLSSRHPIPGLLAITGMIGVFGAWLRIIKTNQTMSSKVRKITRRLLSIGLGTCIGFLALSFKDGFHDIFGIITIVAYYIPGIFGTLMLIGTPEIENKEEVKA